MRQVIPLYIFARRVWLCVKCVGVRPSRRPLRNKFRRGDPHCETAPATRLGMVKKKKDQRKALPPGLIEEEKRVLTKVKRRAHHLDLCLFNCCGVRFGWGTVVGFVPIVGDALDLMLAYMVVKTCDEVKPPLPASVRIKMRMNLANDFIIGLVPLIGDFADAIYKCNTRNALLLEGELRKRGERRINNSSVLNSHST